MWTKLATVVPAFKCLFGTVYFGAYPPQKVEVGQHSIKNLQSLGFTKRTIGFLVTLKQDTSFKLSICALYGSGA